MKSLISVHGDLWRLFGSVKSYPNCYNELADVYVILVFVAIDSHGEEYPIFPLLLGSSLVCIIVEESRDIRLHTGDSCAREILLLD